MNDLQKAISNFYDVSNQYDYAGAADSEPKYVFRFWFNKKIQDIKTPAPTLTADEWQLYTCDKPYKREAKALNKALQGVYSAIEEATYKELLEAACKELW